MGAHNTPCVGSVRLMMNMCLCVNLRQDAITLTARTFTTDACADYLKIAEPGGIQVKQVPYVIRIFKKLSKLMKVKTYMHSLNNTFGYDKMPAHFQCLLVLTLIQSSPIGD